MTTDEMDGLFSEEDKRNKHSVYLQCTECRKWTIQTEGMEYRPCSSCGADKFDMTSGRSIRSYVPNMIELQKRKPKKPAR